MHPMFRELFIETDAEDMVAEEDWRRRVRRSQRARSVMVVRPRRPSHPAQDNPQPRAMAEPTARAYRDVLAVPAARTLIGASAASQIGNWLYNAALLGYVYSATRSAAWVGAATVCRLVPYVLLGPLGGVIADRYRRRTVLLAGDVLRLLVMVALAATVASGGPVVLVIAFTALASAAACAERPAAMALLPRLVGESRLGPANALLHTVQDLGVLIGPAIGAVLLGVAPAWVAFAATGAAFAVSAVLISAMRPDAAVVGGRASGVGQLAEGLRAVRTTAFAPWLIVIVAMVEFTYGAQTVQLVLYATHSLGLGSGGYGVLLTAAGAGGLVSALVNGRLSTSRRVRVVVVVTGLLACATQLAYAGVQVLTIALAVTVIGNAALVSCEVVGETALARIVPREALGRVIGIFDAVSVAAMVAGAVLAPVLVVLTSLRASLVILGAAAVLITAGCGLGLRGLDALNAQRADALASRVEVLQGLAVTVGVPQIVLEQLAAAAQFCPLPPGVDVVVQGAPAHAFYAVADGRVVVHRDGRAVVHLGPGDSFGERGLLDQAPRNATVTTEMDTTLLRVEGAALLDALEAAPGLRPALDLSSTAPGVHVPPGETATVDDPRWTEK
jgi:MFS family permease